MCSRAYERYAGLRDSANYLVDHAAGLRSKAEASAKSIFLHAALAAHTAAWDAYIKQLMEAFYEATAKPLDESYSQIHSIAKQRMLAAKDKLNTPNSENSRNFCMEYAGFDPWQYWSPVGRVVGVQNSAVHVRERLNEIFRVRHSFAHGYTMPAYRWNQNSNGAARLTCGVLRNTAQFFNQLVMETDVGMAVHISQKYRQPRPW